jgi:hypothetical protein
VADHSGAQLNAALVDAQPAAAFENVADYVFVVVINLLGISVSMETKGDETAAELLLLKAALMTDLGIESGEMLERGLEVNDFHNGGIGVMEWWNNGIMLLPKLHHSSTPILP